MRGLAVVLGMLVMALSAEAQPNGKGVLERVSQSVAQMESYVVEFELRMTAATNPSKGDCRIAGDRYVISIDGMMQGFDGEKVWMVDAVAEEVTYDTPRTASRSLFDNPTLAFDFTEELFDVKSVAEEEGTVSVVMEPKEGVLDGIAEVMLVVDSTTGLPASLAYDFGGATIEIVVTNIAPREFSSEEFSILPAKEFPGYEIIDFR